MNGLYKILLIIILLISSIIPLQAFDYDSAISNTQNDSVKFKILFNAVFDVMDRDLKTANDYYSQALEIAEKNNWNWAVYKCYRLKGYIGTLEGNFHTAIKYDKLAFQIALELDTTKIPSILCDLGDDYLNTGNYWLAYECFNRSLLMATDSMDIFYATLNIGIVYREMKLYTLSEIQLIKSKAIAERLQDWEGISYVYHDLAQVYLKQGKYKEAENTIHNAIDICNKYDNFLLVPELYIVLGEVYTNTEDYNKALMYFDDALKIQLSNKNKYGELNTLIGIVRVKAKQKKYIETRKLIQKIMDESENYMNLRIKMMYLYTEICDDNIGFQVDRKLITKFILNLDSLNTLNWKEISEMRDYFMLTQVKKHTDSVNETTSVMNKKGESIRDNMDLILGSVIVMMGLLYVYIFVPNWKKGIYGNRKFLKNR